MARSLPTPHPWDRPFFKAMLVASTSPAVSPTPGIVHSHALFFTAQIVWVRRGQVSTHRKLGMFGAALAACIVILGVMTVFAGLGTAGFLLLRSPDAHKRLMLIATLVLTGAVLACLPIHLLAGGLYFQPLWKDIAMRSIGH